VSFFGSLIDALRRRFRPQPPSPPPPPPNPTPVPAGFRAEFLRLHNTARASKGVPALAENPALDWSAQQLADWMAAHNIQTHNEPGHPLITRLAEAGYHWTTAGENIDAERRTAAEVVGDWLSDGPHRANVLSPAYRDCGFGLAFSRSGVAYWCADYGAPGRVGTTGLAMAVHLSGPVRR
jgi:uncharacterized protein YkwD